MGLVAVILNNKHFKSKSKTENGTIREKQILCLGDRHKEEKKKYKDKDGETKGRRYIVH